MVDVRKIEWVEQLEDMIKQNRYMVLTGFQGLSVEQLENLRGSLYELDSEFCVVKNRLAKLAFERAETAELKTDEKVAEEVETAVLELKLADLDGAGPAKVKALEEAGFNEVADVALAAAEELQEISGVGPALAEKLKASADSLLSEQPVEQSGGDHQVEETADITAGEGSLAAAVSTHLRGSTAIVFTNNEISQVASILVKFRDKTEILELKAGVIEQELIDSEKLERIAELPPRKQLLTALAISLNSPIQKLARYLIDPIYKFVDVLNQVKKEKENQ